MDTVTDEELEKLTTTIQSYLNSNNTAILIGSGASIPYGLPSMGGLTTEIKTKLQDKYKTDSQWKKLIEELVHSGNLEATLDKVELKDEIHKDIIWTVWNLINQKDNEALINFIKNNSTPALTKILKKFVQKTECTNIITTNYDRLIEYATDFSKGKVDTGFSGNYVKRFTQFQNATKRTVNIFKVHGSIDWFKNIDDQNILSIPSFKCSEMSVTYSPLIVTPGNGKYRETHNDPFRTVISKADEALRNSQAYLCIGYGFNDEHIQPIIIDENRSNQKPIVIVTKEVTSKIKELFLKNGIENCLILSEGVDGRGCNVSYSSSETEHFSESYWQLDEFYNLWF